MSAQFASGLLCANDEHAWLLKILIETLIQFGVSLEIASATSPF